MIRIQQMCKNGEIPGAVKRGRSWLIPTDEELNMPETKKKPLPIGISDFKMAVEEYYYVDKTLLIREFLDNRPMVSLFTRPRRFGKTLNMDMLRVFFEKTEEDTSVYFKDKMIWQCGEFYTSYQGKYPVIFLSFKDVKCSSWEETFKRIRELITVEYQRHMELETSDKLNVYEKEVLNKSGQNVAAISISQAIFSGDTEKLQKQLDKFMIESISSFDTANEGFYHGMMLGLCAVLSNRYHVRSNRESGLGRFDIMLIPRVKAIPAFIYEF